MTGPRRSSTLGLLALALYACPAIGQASEPGTASVTSGGTKYEFVVIQCLRDQPAAFGDAIIEFQLDGVPRGTPPEIVERLLGVVEAGDNIQAELRPVVEHGPILSITRVKGGGEQVAVTDMAELMWISDGSPMDADSRHLEIGNEANGARVTGTTMLGGEAATVDASCPD